MVRGSFPSLYLSSPFLRGCLFFFPTGTQGYTDQCPVIFEKPPFSSRRPKQEDRYFNEKSFLRAEIWLKTEKKQFFTRIVNKFSYNSFDRYYCVCTIGRSFSLLEVFKRDVMSQNELCPRIECILYYCYPLHPFINYHPQKKRPNQNF